MSREWGLGPVFRFEWMIGARRWQSYLARVLFLLCLVAGLSLIWAPATESFRNLSQLAAIGRQFFLVVITIQLTAILLAAPAATAGAICVDKGRGTLVHALVTDLNAREIVYGKLAARLAPVLALVACGLPVLALSGLLGGIDLIAAVEAYLVTVGVAILGCTLALVFSVWARKPHQALLPTYAILLVWVGTYPLLHVYNRWTAVWATASDTERFAAVVNPYLNALARTMGLVETPLMFQILLLQSLVLLSLVFARVAADRLRMVVLEQSNRPARRGLPGVPARLVGLLPGPSLDHNPVLWREWHRKRPSRWTGRFWAAYTLISAGASLGVIVAYFMQPLHGVNEVAAQVNAWEITIGLLLLSVSAATALGEERDRGSLDIVMATPLPTRSIVWAKWWGTMAMVPRLAILPIWVASALALVSGHWIGLALMIGLILAYSAAITSLGLALATWIPRLSRAVTASVLCFMLMTVGSTILIRVTFSSTASGLLGGQEEGYEKLMMANPFFGIYRTTESVGRFGGYWANFSYYSDWIERDPTWPLCWLLGDVALSAWLLFLTLATFDRCLGRTRERPPTAGERRRERVTRREAARRGDPAGLRVAP